MNSDEMRLDQYLVSAGYFTTRQKAKEAVKRGFVKVDGRTVRKPSKDVRGDERIDVLCEERPRGYWKLKELDGMFGLLSEKDVVLDVGSSAGGFLMYCAERCERVVGIEVSEAFREQINGIVSRFSNAEVIFEDVFRIDPEKLPEFDVMLVDLTLEPEDSFKAMSRLLCRLKEGGRVLFVVKGMRVDDREKAEKLLRELQEKHDFKELRVKKVAVLDRNESYLLLE